MTTQKYQCLAPLSNIISKKFIRDYNSLEGMPLFSNKNRFVYIEIHTDLEFFKIFQKKIKANSPLADENS